MSRTLSLIMIFLVIPISLAAQSMSTHMYIRGLERASAPEYHQASDSMVFTYQAQSSRFQPRHVGISFDHEKFTTVHSMSYVDVRNDADELIRRVYFIFVPIDESIQDLSAIKYRFVIDGVWIEDPQNPQYEEKISGRRMSVVALPTNREIAPVSPEIHENQEQSRSKLVDFRFYADPGQQVFLAGSFNNWDPFMYPMQESLEKPGEYFMTLRLLPGEYHYNYYYRGRRIKDPLNTHSSYDIEGYEYSTFAIQP